MQVVVKPCKKFLRPTLSVCATNHENTESRIPEARSKTLGSGLHKKSVVIRYSGLPLAFWPRVHTGKRNDKVSGFLLIYKSIAA